MRIYSSGGPKLATSEQHVNLEELSVFLIFQRKAWVRAPNKGPMPQDEPVIDELFIFLFFFLEGSPFSFFPDM